MSVNINSINILINELDIMSCITEAFFTMNRQYYLEFFVGRAPDADMDQTIRSGSDHIRGSMKHLSPRGCSTSELHLGLNEFRDNAQTLLWLQGYCVGTFRCKLSQLNKSSLPSMSCS